MKYKERFDKVGIRPPKGQQVESPPCDAPSTCCPITMA